MGNNHPMIKHENLETLKKNNQTIIFIDKKVFNITEYLNQHPGGKECLLKYNLKDTKESYNFHSSSAKKLWKKYFIGVLE
jgi:cytochrome b involved in lipid metabolism